jgi:hypothetical protein
VDAAEFLQYHASEGGIVDRILMNLHLDILAQAALLPRPGSYRVEGHGWPNRGEDGGFDRASTFGHGFK